MRLWAVRGDITEADVDVIVNAANPGLLGGGGVDGAIHRAGGPAILEECRAVKAGLPEGRLPRGQAVATAAGRLPARWVVHTVGPNLHRGQSDPVLLSSCFARPLELAVELGASSIAFPAVSAGVYGWAVEDVARIAVGTVRVWQEGVAAGGPGPEGIELVRFVLFSAGALDAFRSELDRA